MKTDSLDPRSPSGAGIELGQTHPLTREGIDAAVRETRPGVYTLGPLRAVQIGQLPPLRALKVFRVGRSDEDVNARLHSYLKDAKFKECTHFRFAYLTTAREAFDEECRLYHRYDEPPLNEYHPDRPAGRAYACPVSKCTAFGDD